MIRQFCKIRLRSLKFLELCRLTLKVTYHNSTAKAIQADVDAWLIIYNNERPHSGKHCFGKTPMQTFRDSIYIAKEKNIGTIERISDNLLSHYQAV